MLAVVGTVPMRDFPLVEGEVDLRDGTISIQGNHVPVNRGAPALLAAAIKAGQFLDHPPPHGYLVGDIGLGDGSRRLCEYLIEHLGKSHFQTLTFHYIQPDIGCTNRVLFVIERMPHKPTLIADAGSMYAAKMSGKSSAYDLFTPDIGELAFLADEEAPHPFYTRGFILHEENRVPELITRSYTHNNAARYLLVKGETDYVADREGILETVDHPVVKVLEAIGGTGDTLTGIVSALIDSGMEIREAAAVAARVNRLAGQYGKPTAATQVMELVSHIPEAMQSVLSVNDRGKSWPKTAKRMEVVSALK